MSAFIVNKKHIDALLTWAIKREQPIWFYHDGHRMIARDGAHYLGVVLTEANYRSVNYRYEERSKAPQYVYTEYPRVLTPVEVLKACDCYDYQACEVADYRGSLAAAIVQAIRQRAIAELPGYEEAAWAIE